MVRVAVFGLPMLVLAMGVPWFFVGQSEGRVLGLPLWAAYAVAADLVFAVVLAFMIGRFWNFAAGSGSDDDDDGGAAGR